MKVYGEWKYISIHSNLSLIDVSDQLHDLGAFNQSKELHYPLNTRLGWSQSQAWYSVEEKI